MARIRTIKPDFWTSAQVMKVSRDARLMFIGLWGQCDDCGNCPADCWTLKAKLFPMDHDIGPDELAEWVAELVGVGLMAEYEVEGGRYWHVTGWHHQRIEKPTGPKYPPFPDDSPTTPGGFPDDSGRTTGALRLDRKGEDGIGGESKGREGRAPHSPRGERLPTAWMPNPDLRAWAAKTRPDLDIEDTLAAFRDYWNGKPGKDGLKLDWPGTFRNWIRHERSPPRNGYHGPDIAHITVPSKPGPDPALQKIEADRLRAAPMPEAVRAKVALLRRKTE